VPFQLHIILALVVARPFAGRFMANGVDRLECLTAVSRALSRDDPYQSIVDTLVEASPLPIACLAPTGEVLSWNPAAERIFGWSAREVLGRRNPTIPAERWEEFGQLIGRALAGERVSAFETRRRGRSGTAIPVAISMAPLPRCPAAEPRVVVTYVDLSEQVQAETELQRVAARLKRAERIAKVGSFEWDIGSDELIWSDEMYRIFGLEPGSWTPSVGGFLERVHPDDAPSKGASVVSTLSTGRPYHSEYRIIRPDGSVRALDSRGEVQLGLDGRPERLIGTAQDVTERKAAEAELLESHEQLRSLAQRLAAIREEERTRISREIHDELGQGLTALKLDLAWLRSRADAAARERIGEMLQLLDGTMSAVRRIANDLRPGVLDHLGLAAAIGWQAEQFSARTGVECRVRIQADPGDLDEHRSTALFRVFQEGLTNIARHAHARRVVVVLRRRNGVVELSLADDGRGISEADAARLGRLGLVGMRERARECGGLMRIAPRRGGGTILTVRLPVRPESERKGV
jgi:PAS domain S-box-containing protein